MWLLHGHSQDGGWAAGIPHPIPQCTLPGCDLVSEQLRLATEEFLTFLRKYGLHLSSFGI